jgi:hypothetical protein
MKGYSRSGGIAPLILFLGTRGALSLEKNREHFQQEAGLVPEQIWMFEAEDKIIKTVTI